MSRLTQEDRDTFHKYLDTCLDKLESEKNRKKPHWLSLADATEDNLELYELLKKEIAELGEELVFLGKDLDRRSDLAVDECRDVVNFALMIYDRIENGFE